MFQILRPAFVLAATVLVLQAPATAQLRTGHAIPGFHGLESSVPPPLGLTYANDTVVYSADTQRDRDGHAVPGAGSITQITNNSTLLWASPWLLLGGNWVMGLRIPLTNGEPNPFSTSLTTGGVGLGDVLLEPLALYWEGRSHHLHMKYGVWLPTGDFTFDAVDNYGKGFLTHEISMGVTFYPRRQRDWHISLLGRYEIHDEIEGAKLTPGQDLILDWSVGKHLGERWNAGVVGYSVWQVSLEGGTDGNRDAGFYGTAALGGEVRYEIPDWRGDVHLRGLWEYNAFNRPEGLSLFLGLSFGF